jgi:TPR repeat protein
MTVIRHLLFTLVTALEVGNVYSAQVAKLAVNTVSSAGNVVAVHEKEQKAEAAAAELLTLAAMYRAGDRVKKDIPSALSLYERAAEAGAITAYSDIGEIYLNGEGGAPDLKKALCAFERGELKGDLFSTYSLGDMYLKGEGVQQDGKRAAQLFATLFSRLQGMNIDESVRPYYALGYYAYCYMYANGIGVEKDDVRSWEYMRKAAQYGSADAIAYFEMVLEDYTSERSLAAEAALLLGALYEKGESVPRDLERAFLLYAQATKLDESSGYKEARHLIWSGSLKKALVEELGENKAQEKLIALVSFLKQGVIVKVPENDICPICLNSWGKSGELCIANPCLHLFCSGCSNALLRVREKKCPICKEKIVLG